MKEGYPTDTQVRKVKKIIPIEYTVLVEPDQVEQQTSGGLYLPDTARDKQQHAVDKGVVVEIAGKAFADDAIWTDKPKVGDWVLYDKYAGTLIQFGEGRDKKTYRLINDKSVKAILEEDNE